MMTMLMDAEQWTPGLPADLRQDLGEGALLELALEAVQTVGARLSRPLGSDERYGPPMLLTLLTYCYASGVYGSEDIAYDCRNDAAVRYLCANTAPDQETIRNFRRANREWIEESLAWVYRNACDLKPEAVRRDASPVFAPKVCTADLAGLVRRRLELAILFDTAMSD
jgi:hypothetical protein